jgi:branched-chain amino acid transport system ATP-binding protein
MSVSGRVSASDNGHGRRDDLLTLDAVDAGYGPFHALFGVSFAVAPGSVTALLGANGAGKTTVARVCSGLVHPTAGQVTFASTDITAKKAFEVARLGVSHAPEGRSVFASLSVEENLALPFRNALGRDGAKAALDRAYELFPRLGERSSQIAGSLSGGEQRMLSLARVLANPPKLLVVDELSLGLAPIIIDEVYANLAKVSAQGTALLVIEQHVDHALALADQVVVLQQGHVSYAGPTLSADELAPYLLPAGSP